MVWIDSKKAYDMVPQSWIIDCLKMYKTSDELMQFIENTMEIWNVELTAWGKKTDRDLPGRCSITITICNGDDATQSHT